MRTKYSIPEHGEVLRAAHLREHTAFTIAEAARAFQGRWGFFRPPCSNLDEDVNHFLIENGYLVARNLALILPDGFTCQEEELRTHIPTGGGAVRVTWTLPEHSDEKDGSVRIGLEIISKGDMRENGADTDSEKTSCDGGTIGEVNTERNSVVLNAPALSLDAVAALHDAWKGLRCAIIKQVARPMERLADQVERVDRGGIFERRLARGALRRLGRVPSDADPGMAVRELQAAVERLADFAETYAGAEVTRETTSLLEAAGVAPLGVGADQPRGPEGHSGTGVLIDFFENIATVVNRRLKNTTAWLEGANRIILQPARKRDVDEGARVVREYLVPGNGGRSVFITLSDRATGQRQIDPWIRFTDWKPLETRRVDGGGELQVPPFDLPPGIQEFWLKCAPDVEVDVTVEA